MGKIAVIDIGSNTVQLMLATAAAGRLSERRNIIRTTRLGAGDRPGHLSATAIAHTAEAVAEFMRLGAAEQVSQCRIIATAAAREADNCAELRAAIRQAAPDAPELEVVDGQREAELSYAGVRAAHAFPVEWPVADVGGSSSELICVAHGSVSAVSAKVGAVRATMNEWGREQISAVLRQSYGFPPQAAGLVGVGGTITTAAGVELGLAEYDREAIEGQVLSAEQLQRQIDRLLPLSPQQRCAQSPLLEKRGEIIVAGLWIWLAIMELLRVDSVSVTGCGLMDGVAIEML